MNTSTKLYNSNNKLELLPAAKDRIMSRILIPKNKDDCWEWLGFHTKFGYSRINLGFNINPDVHRIMYELVKGKVPKGLELDHLCRNKGCINPDHLEAVTHVENQKRGKVNQNKNKTHCKRGHEFIKDNTYVNSKGVRACKECIKLRGKGLI